MTLRRDVPVLVVDDSPAILALMRDLLKAKGYTNVRVAASPEEAIARLAEEPPQLVFLDLMMPNESGLETMKRIQEASPRAHIVVTTALPPGHEAVVMAVSQGAEEYLPKPLRPQALTTVLDHVESNIGYDQLGYG